METGAAEWNSVTDSHSANASNKHKKKFIEALRVHVSSNDQSLNLETDESYVLDVSSPHSFLSVQLSSPPPKPVQTVLLHLCELAVRELFEQCKKKLESRVDAMQSGLLGNQVSTTVNIATAGIGCAGKHCIWRIAWFGNLLTAVERS